MTVFDRTLKAHQRDCAARAPDYEKYSYLHAEVASRLLERLDDIHESYDFQDAVDIGCGNGHARRLLGGRGIERLLECDSSAEMLALSAADAKGPNAPEFTVKQLHIDEEELELPPKSADLIISSMALHWINDLPGALVKARRALKPNGLFLAAFLGGETLAEMRSSFVLADLERHGGVSQHMSPLASMADAGALLHAAGFALPTVDTEVIRVGYPDAWTLWHHLRAMGESNATLRRTPSNLATLLASAAIYRELYGDEEGNIAATFQVIYMIGWGPSAADQPRPLPRGSGQVSLKELGLEFPPLEGPPLPEPKH